MIRCFKNPEALSRAAADAVCAAGRDALRERGRFCWALAGGSTPHRLHQLLSESPRRDALDWRRTEIFFGDERAVPPDHKDSNYRLAREALLDRVGLPQGRIHRIRGEAPDGAAEALRYQEEMARVFGIPAAAPPPSLDLIVLGLGDDGHTASLFPGSPALGETGRWYVASEGPAAPRPRITATPPLLNAARDVLFLVAGDGKAAALARVLQGPDDPACCPAQLVAPAGRLTWYVDQAAATELHPPPPAEPDPDSPRSGPGTDRGGKSYDHAMSTPNDELVTLATFGPLHEANIAKAKLELAGIESFLAGEHVSSLEGMFALGVRLQVRASQAEAARAALAAQDEPAPDPE